MALKTRHADIAFAGNKITPDELGFTQAYTVINPSISSTWFGTAVGTSTQSPTFGIINAYADYPRNIRYVVGVASGSTGGGTATVVGKDQFGSAVSETAGVAVAANGGTVIGTQVFSQVTAITGSLGTMNAGNGTISIGVGTSGTTTLFGLPARLGATTDIVSLNGSFTGVGTQTAGTFVFGGTPSTAANTAVHAFKAPLDVAAGTVVYNVRYRPSYPTIEDSMQY
jgi:hypothetical protein